VRVSNAGYRVFRVFNVTFLILLTVSFLFPYLNALAIAFNDPMNSRLGGLTVFPRVFSMLNFESLFKQEDITRAAVISALRVVSGTIISLVITFAAGYAFTKKGFRGRSALLIFLIIPMYLNGGLIPFYILVNRIHIINTFWMYIIPYSFSFFNMVIIRVYINTNIPDSIEEAAKIDGANDIMILLRIVVPLCAPIIATICLFMAVYHWNDWTTTLMFVSGKSQLATLQYKLMQVLKESETLNNAIMDSIKRGAYSGQTPTVTPESLQSAMVIATTLPIIAVYPFLQKYFLKGAVIGALKD